MGYLKFKKSCIKKIMCLFFLFFMCISFSQQYTLSNALVESFIKDVSAVESTDIIINVKIDKDNFHEIGLSYLNETSSFKLKPLAFPSFEAKLKNEILKVLKKKQVETIIPKSNDIKNKIALVFTQIVTHFNTEEDLPVVANVYLKDSIPVFYHKETMSIGYLESATAELSFYGGFIEKIQVKGTINDMPVAFNNTFSIGISSTKNIQELGNNVLYTTERFLLKDVQKSLSVDNTKDAKQVSRERKGYKFLSIFAGDVIRYVKKIDVNANDISPYTQLVLLDTVHNQSKLYKEESSKLIEVKLYSDAITLFDDDESPNGLIQLEVSKKFNLNTRRIDVGWIPKYCLPFLLAPEGFGFFESFEAKFQFSKIEKNNKLLLPQNFDILDDANVVTSSEEYYTQLSLFQHKNYSIGGDLNLFTFENQNTKLNVFINMGIAYSRSGIKENELDINGSFVNNIEIPFEYKILILPEKRISFSFSDRLTWFETLDDKINVKSLENNKLSSKKRWINSFNIDVNYDISSTGKLFLRYKLIHEFDHINNNFSQLQFGYSFYFLKNNGAKKNSI